MEEITAAYVRRLLPRRDPMGHKGTFGKVLCVCGSVGFSGAAVFAGRAAVRTGSGLVYLGVPEPVWPVAAMKCDEVMPFPLPSEEGKLSPLAEGAIRQRAGGCDAVLVGCGHPFRAGGHVPELPQEQLRRLKFLDLNGKDLALDRDRTERLTYALGKELEIPVVSGSDTHQAVQYGCVTTVFEREVDTVPALYGEMTAGRYAIDLSDTAAFQVRTACLLKRSLKEIHALGGDYVAILTREATA